MCRKRHIVTSDGRFWVSRVARGILGADDRGGEEGGGRDQVGSETDDVDACKGWSRADSRPSLKVEEWLRIEG